MAAFYELRYWKNITQPDGSIIRLEIHGKGIEGISMTAYEIGPVVQALALNIQGQTDDVDAPIVKTSLTMTFVDAPDHADAWLKKCGDWEEFYTNDATMWKVLLKGKKNASSSSYAQLWGGYITPDSFSEELRYRGSVTIVARDNIGHMQDFPFDAEGDENGMISLRELVRAAWEKIESPMELYLEDARQWMQCDGVQAYNTMMNASAFKGMNWYEAVEKALYAYGAVMRYNGQNEVLVSSLRYMPQQGKGNMDAVTHVEPVFIASAHRELVPAARRIEESVDYDISPASMPLVKVADFTGAVAEVFDETGFTAKTYHIDNVADGGGWKDDESNPLYFNVAAYSLTDTTFSYPFTEDERENLPSSMMLLCNNKEGEAVFSRYVHAVDCQFKMILGNRYSVEGAGSSALLKQSQEYCKITSVQYAVRVVQNGITSYLQGDGEWNASRADLSIISDTHIGEFTIEIPFKVTGNALLEIIIKKIESNVTLSNVYVAVNAVSMENLSSVPMLKRNKVNTRYDETNNVIISRNPEFGPAYNVTALSGFIKNGIFYYDGNIIKPAKAWNWDGGTPQQMAVYNHLQLLCYHSKPNNLITGDIVNADVIKTAAIYVWGGAEHLLISGTYNYLNGRIEGAVLREFVRYDDMWGDVTGSSLPDVQTDSTTNAEEGGPSSSGVINENTTNVVIGGEGGGSVTIDPFLSDTSSNPVESKAIKAYIDSADNEIKERIAALEEGGDVDHPVFEFTFDSATNKATAEMVAALAEAIAANKLILCNGRTYKFILEQDGMYGLVSDAYMDITDGKLKASVLAVVASSYDVQLMEEEVPVGTEITEETVRGWGFTKNAGTITGIMMNGATKGTSGVVDLGNVLTEHQKLKTINNQSIVGEGNITIQGGGAAPRVEMTETSAVLQPNTFHVWPMMDALDLTLGAEQTGVMNRYLFQFRNPKAGLTMLTLPDTITWSEDTELDENGMPVMEAAAFYRIEIIEGLASLKKWKLVYINFADAEVEAILLANGVGDGIGITKGAAKAVKSWPFWFRENTTIESFDEFKYFTGVALLPGGNSVSSLPWLYNGSFAGCTNLKSIVIPKSVTEIGHGSFGGCTALESIGDISQVTKIKVHAFHGCTSLVIDVLELPNVKELQGAAFHGCKIKKLVITGLATLTAPGGTYKLYGDPNYLEEVVLSDEVTNIPSLSFSGYAALRTINLANVITISNNTFNNSGVVNIDAHSATKMQSSAFENCASLISIDISSLVTLEGHYHFRNCTSLTGAIVCNSLTRVGGESFRNTKITSVNAPSVTLIDFGGFRGCSELVTATFEDALATISSQAFSDCKKLRVFRSGAGVTTIAVYAFQNCTSLEAVIIGNTTPPSLHAASFTGASSTFIIYVPDESVEAYKAATNWNTYASRIKGISEYTG